MKRMILVGVLATAALVAGVANAATETFTAALAAPAGITSSGKGTGTFTFDTTSKALTYSVTYEGLTGPATMAHIHGPADPGANAAASPITGTATLTDAQVADLEAGKYYVNIHTAANRGGEIRGQLVKK